MVAAGLNSHLNNPCLLQEMVNKLPTHFKLHSRPLTKGINTISLLLLSVLLCLNWLKQQVKSHPISLWIKTIIEMNTTTKAMMTVNRADRRPTKVVGKNAGVVMCAVIAAIGFQIVEQFLRCM